MNQETNTRPHREPIATPCVQICQIDNATGLCRGCGRSRAEIARWGSISNEERLRIMAELPARLKNQG